MKFFDLKTQLKDYVVFSIRDIEKNDPSFHKQRLGEWQKKEYIKKICKGYYIFSDLPLNESVLCIIANKIYSPSYVSLETALSFYNLIPEGVYSITSVTSRRRAKQETSIGTFNYRHIQPSMLFGYKLVDYIGHSYQIAEAEKAILDFLYFNPKVNDKESFKGMRFNVDHMHEIISIEKFKKYCDAFGKKSLQKRASVFLTYIQNAKS